MPKFCIHIGEPCDCGGWDKAFGKCPQQISEEITARETRCNRPSSVVDATIRSVKTIQPHTKGMRTELDR